MAQGVCLVDCFITKVEVGKMPSAADNASPEVTVAIAARNAERTIAHTIRSVLAQTMTEWELIIFDDGSNDRTAVIAENFCDPRITTLRFEEPKGLARRLNEAVSRARGRYFARLDADDICYPDRFLRQAEYLDKHGSTDVVACRAIVFDQRGIPLGILPWQKTHEAICARPRIGFPFPHPTWMGRTTWFRKHRYDESFRRAQDFELLLRTFAHSRFATLDTVLVGYRHDAPSLRKLLSSRYYASRALLRYGVTHFDAGSATLAAGTQAAKALFEAAAFTVGATQQVKRRRLMTASGDETKMWQSVWNQISEGN